MASLKQAGAAQSLEAAARLQEEMSYVRLARSSKDGKEAVTATVEKHAPHSDNR